MQKQIDLKVYGFYIGEMDVPVAQVDLPIRTAKFLTVTPSYMGYWVPASGLNKLTPQPGSFTDSYEEHQFRVDGTVAFAVRKFEISGRNMYVRRFRPDSSRRYQSLSRSSFDRASPHRSRPHLEAFCLIRNLSMSSDGGWNRDRVWSGVTLPLNKRVFVQPSYLWETSEGSRNVDYLLFGLIVNTR